MSALSLPPDGEDKLASLVEEHWAALKDIPSLDLARYVTAPSRMAAFADFTAEQIWAAIVARRQGSGATDATDDDLKVAEWDALIKNPPPSPAKDFLVTRVPAPQGFECFFEETVLLERLREVRALLTFTRIESKGDFADAAYVEDGRETPLSRESPIWLPASEVRGEGLFLRLKEGLLQKWENRSEVKNLEQDFFEAHKAWRRLRKQNPAEAGFPGIRFILLHSLSHALMRGRTFGRSPAPPPARRQRPSSGEGEGVVMSTTCRSPNGWTRDLLGAVRTSCDRNYSRPTLRSARRPRL
jgi:hypothetical protein